MSPLVSVFIPTWNAGPELDLLLKAIKAQTGVALEILVTDSNSSDGATLAALKNHGIAYEHIEPQDFNHGAVRNAAARRARGEFIAFLSQDALPLTDDYLLKLLAPLDDPKVWASYASQWPRADAHPFQLLNLERHMEEATGYELRPSLDRNEWQNLSPEARVASIRFDDVASLIRRSALISQPFEERRFGEDLAWSRTAVLAGGAIAFVRDAQVRHSHALSHQEFYSRTAAVHELLRELCDFVPMPNRLILVRRILGTSWRFLRAAWSVGNLNGLKRLGASFSAPYWACLQMTAMWRGSRRGRYLEP